MNINNINVEVKMSELQAYHNWLLELDKLLYEETDYRLFEMRLSVPELYRVGLTPELALLAIKTEEDYRMEHGIA